MRTRNLWLVGLLTAAMTVVTGASRGQEVPPADPVFPLPIYHDRPEAGGFYLTSSFVMYRQTNPMGNQPIVLRGFFDADNTFGAGVGHRFGSGRVAQTADDVGGPGTYQPGFKVSGGWRSATAPRWTSWMHLFKARYTHVASFVPPFFLSGRDLADSFLTAPVFNFPVEFAGPVATGNLTPTGFPAQQGDFRSDVNDPNNPRSPGYGIWNAAELSTLDFTQRTERFDITFRKPIFEITDEDCGAWRCYGLVGPRFFWVWEGFKWRMVDLDWQGVDNPLNVAQYTNQVSNRMYGVHAGFGHEWYLGHGFAIAAEGRPRSSWTSFARRPSSSAARSSSRRTASGPSTYTVVPGFTGTLSLWWYPIEGIQVQVGYDVMAFFNTVGAVNPVTFDYGGMDPAWERHAAGSMAHAGIGVIF
jgi:hypothetical protein